MNDKTLKIDTKGIYEVSKKQHYRYEPTSYQALNTLFENVKINKDDHFVDFGCGKGRVSFYVNYKFQCQTIGIEYDQIVYQESLKNKLTYINDNKQVKFFNINALDYKINDNDNIFYFFNPFSIKIFRRVITNILNTYDKYRRKMTIILYYPSQQYLTYLNNLNRFERILEIKVNNKDIFDRFIIFEIKNF